MRAAPLTGIFLLVALALAAYLAQDTLARYELVPVVRSYIGPVLEQGALAVTEHVPVQQLGPGDIVAYRHPSEPSIPVFLRVVETQGAGGTQSTGRRLRLQGDSAAAPPPWEVEWHGTAQRLVTAVPGAGRLAALDVAAARPWVVPVTLLAGTITAAVAWRRRPRAVVVPKYRPDAW